MYWSRDPEGSSTSLLVKGRTYSIRTHTHTHTHTRGFFFLNGCIRFLTPGRRVLSLRRGRIRLRQHAHTIGFLADCLFSPKCQRISINFSQNLILGVGMRDPSDAITAEGSHRHHGGGRVREGGDTVEAWSRGAEPFLLVDRFETCLARVLRWSRHTNGP